MFKNAEQHPTKTIQCYCDPGHAWAKVKRKELAALGILESISHYSYQRGEYVFLEEDSDLSTYAKAMEDKGIKLLFKGSVSDRSSRIRSYESFRN